MNTCGKQYINIDNRITYHLLKKKSFIRREYPTKITNLLINICILLDF